MRITREELVILSFPGPDRSIKMDALRQGKAVSRRYRNRRIGEFLKELELTEGRSTGIPKMLRVMASNGSPTPEFETDEDRTHYLVRLPVHPNADWQDLTADKSTGQVDRQVEATRGPSKAPVKAPVSEKIPQILRHLNQHGATGITELLELLELKNKRRLRENHLTPTIDQGYIEWTEPNSPNSPAQKYRLTAKGRELLKTL
ncbi:ATP-binding protein [Coraliomargarita sp. SDUM461003]|uniref:ATP-binding protein n=1 Tax=Thalassobacterium maritimum TaxID=3041265 RepID=A0ABU1ARX8_9BACT|nr:ATP-binding protein [Coraliomargarita sp. SDUM461003]MDQ8206911.1 ATP-binding protein [Coraliomargarita sp. SDUM461003]